MRETLGLCGHKNHCVVIELGYLGRGSLMHEFLAGVIWWKLEVPSNHRASNVWTFTRIPEVSFECIKCPRVRGQCCRLWDARLYALVPPPGS